MRKFCRQEPPLQDVLTSLEERIADRRRDLRQKQFYEALVEHSPIAIVPWIATTLSLLQPGLRNAFRPYAGRVRRKEPDTLITTPRP
jgi:hypothetical protein